MKKTNNIVVPYNKIDQLLTVAGELAYLADAYAGGESESGQELCKQLDELSLYFSRLQDKQNKVCCH